MSSFFFPFLTVNVRKFELARALFGQRTKKNVRISEKFELLEFELSDVKHKSFLRQTQRTSKCVRNNESSNEAAFELPDVYCIQKITRLS